MCDVYPKMVLLKDQYNLVRSKTGGIADYEEIKLNVNSLIDETIGSGRARTHRIEFVGFRYINNEPHVSLVALVEVQFNTKQDYLRMKLFHQSVVKSFEGLHEAMVIHT